jgi:hypothetical protein
MPLDLAEWQDPPAEYSIRVDKYYRIWGDVTPQHLVFRRGKATVRFSIDARKIRSIAYYLIGRKYSLAVTLNMQVPGDSDTAEFMRRWLVYQRCISDHVQLLPQPIAEELLFYLGFP